MRPRRPKQYCLQLVNINIALLLRVEHFLRKSKFYTLYIDIYKRNNKKLSILRKTWQPFDFGHKLEILSLLTI